MNKIPVVFITDNNFAIPTAVAISSLIESRKEEASYDVRVVCIEVEEWNIQNLRKIATENVSVTILDASNKYHKLNVKHPHVSKAALFKFDLPNLFPELKKILYLDGDVLVKKDLLSLSELDIDQFYVAAVRDMVGERAMKLNSLVGVDKYFNSGVMLLNLEKMRLDDISDKLLNAKLEKTEFKTMDQDVLNYVFGGEVLWVGPQYNLMAYNLIQMDYPIELINDFYQTKYAGFKDMFGDAFIIHLTNNKKPWLNKFTLLNGEWFKYFDKLALFNAEDIKKNKAEDYETEINSLKVETELARTKTIADEDKKSLEKCQRELRNLEPELKFIKSSRLWKVYRRYLKLKQLNLEYFSNLAQKAVGVLKRDGLFTFLKFIYKYLIHGRGYFRLRTGGAVASYKPWIEKNENWNRGEIKKQIDNFSQKPKISVITPVFNVKPIWLDLCIQSVLDQFYDNWELCLYDDASTSKETIECLKKWEGKDDRIKIGFGKENQHISGASNEALKMATGEFVALLDNDDELAPHALFEAAKVINEKTDVDFIYSDEDKVEAGGMRSDPFFKPDWSLHWLLTANYVCHLSVFRKKIVDEIGGFRKGFEGSQDYDLILRFVEKIKEENIAHVPQILYHWRKIAGSTAKETASKSYTDQASDKLLADYIQRNKINAAIEKGLFPGAFRIKRKLSATPLVSIIIPTKDKADYLKACVLSVLEKTDYPNFEIIILDTGSREDATKNFYKNLKNNSRIRIIDYPNPEFNFAEANTWAAQHASGEYLLFLNNDTEVINSEWLSSMMEYALLGSVGIVGPKLLFPDGTIQHMGVAIGLREGASHPGVLYPDRIFMGHPFLHAKDVVRDVSAVTGACLLMRKDIFDRVGGFDSRFKIAFNDIDLCLKARRLGLHIVYTPYAKLIHHESVTLGRPYDNPNRSSEFFEKERDFFRTKWDIANFEDPFYNKNLTLDDESLRLKI